VTNLVNGSIIVTASGILVAVGGFETVVVGDEAEGCASAFVLGFRGSVAATESSAKVIRSASRVRRSTALWSAVKDEVEASGSLN
jgi:hypothetical protein